MSQSSPLQILEPPQEKKLTMERGHLARIKKYYAGKMPAVHIFTHVSPVAFF